MKLRTTQILFIALWSAVAHTRTTDSAPFATVTVELKNGEIEAEYQLASPVKRLPFARDTTQYRPESWRVLSRGITLENSALVTASEQGFERVRILVKPLVRSAQKDYDPVLDFSDGGRAVYTGQFDVSSALGDTAFELRASQQTPVVVAGVQHRQPVRYAPAYVGDGTYAYFGTSPLLELPFGLAVVDPALPAWTLSELRSFVPALLKHYGDRIGPTTAHSFILFDYDPRPEAGMGLGGDVLPGLLRMALYGPVWAEPDAKWQGHLRRTLAHEVAHFWNLDNDDEAAPWLHEGSADALATLALHELGHITFDELTDLRDEALNRCLLKLDGRSINEASRQHSYESAYDCGHVISLLTASTLQQTKPQLDLYRFWRALRKLAAMDGGSYNQGHYLATLVELTGNARLAAFVYSFANQRAPEVVALTEAFAKAGQPLSPMHKAPTRPLGVAIYQKLISHLMAQDCAGKHRFNTSRDRIELLDLPNCRTVKKPLTVTHLSGFAMYDEAPAAYAAVAAVCAKGDALPLGEAAAGTAVSLRCDKPIAPLQLLTFRPATTAGAASPQN